MFDSTTLNLMVVGFLVGFPVVAYGLFDLARIPARLYHFTPYSRPVWVTAILTGYACFGLGGIVMVGVWLGSPERAELRDDLVRDQRWNHPAVQSAPTRAVRRRHRARRHRLTAAAVTLPVILVAAATVTRGA